MSEIISKELLGKVLGILTPEDVQSVVIVDNK